MLIHSLGVSECHALLNLTLQFRHHLVEPHLFVLRQVAERQYFLDAILPDFDRRCEEGCVCQRAFDERTLNDVLSSYRLEQVFCEDVSRVGHAEGGAASARLRRHDLVTSEFYFRSQRSFCSMRINTNKNEFYEGEDFRENVATRARAIQSVLTTHACERSAPPTRHRRTSPHRPSRITVEW